MERKRPVYDFLLNTEAYLHDRLPRHWRRRLRPRSLALGALVIACTLLPVVVILLLFF